MIHKTLDSGLKVALIPMPGVKSVTVLAMVGVGSRFEDKSKNGISHFLEHMVFKGTDKWPEAADLAQTVDGVGAEFNAYTGKEYTAFYVKSASRHLNMALDVISDMMYTARLRADDLEREKGVIVEEINMYNDLPQRRVADLFDRAMYGDVGLGRKIDGEKEIVKSFTRDDFLTHIKTWYGLENVTVVVAGDSESLSDQEKIIGEIDKAFSKAGDRRKLLGIKRLETKPSEKERLVVEFKKSDQAHVVMGFPGWKITHPKRTVLSILSVIMGGNMSSRLFIEVREKRGLAYYSRAEVDRYLDTGAVGAAMGVDVKRVEEAIKVAKNVFMEVVEDGANKITEEELNRAKEFLAGSIILDMEDSRSVAEYWAVRMTQNDELIDPDAMIERVRKVTREEVVAVAKELFDPKKLVLTIIGPYKNQLKFVKLLE
jgi:predicted Zn-dependent peptidase